MPDHFAYLGDPVHAGVGVGVRVAAHGDENLAAGLGMDLDDAVRHRTFAGAVDGDDVADLDVGGGHLVDEGE